MSVIKEKILSVYNHLVLFDFEESLVHYNYSLQSLEISQKGKSVSLSPLSKWYSHEESVKPGLLHPEDLQTLLDTMLTIINDSVFSDELISMSVRPYGFDIYKLSFTNYKYTTVFSYSLRFTSTTNPGILFIRRLFNKNFKTLYKINGPYESI